MQRLVAPADHVEVGQINFRQRVGDTLVVAVKWVELPLTVRHRIEAHAGEYLTVVTQHLAPCRLRKWGAQCDVVIVFTQTDECDL